MATTQPAGGPQQALAEDEAGFKRGRSGMLWGMLAAIVVLLGGAWLLLSSDDDLRVYGEIGRKVNGLRQASFDQFWACALPGKNLQDIKSNADLVTQLEGRAAEGGKPYAVHLRDACSEVLTRIEPALDNLIAPPELDADVQALKNATRDLRSSVGGFVAWLDAPDKTYDTSHAAPHLQSISRAWYDFRSAHANLNKTLKSKLK